MSTVIYPQKFNAGVSPGSKWQSQLEKALVGSREYLAKVGSDGVKIQPVLPKDASLREKLIHFITPTLVIPEGQLKEQSPLNAFLNKKENDLSTMPRENSVLVCTVELTNKANDFMGAVTGISMFYWIALGALFGVVRDLSPPIWTIGATYLWPLVFVPFAIMGYWGYAFDVQNRALGRYRELLQKTIQAQVGTFVWLGERP